MARKIINLTQHVTTAQQAAEGVFEPSDKKEISRLLTFVGIESTKEMAKRASRLAQIAREELDAKGAGDRFALIAGAPFFMADLENALGFQSIEPLYAFSERCSEEQVDDKGIVVKSGEFFHLGFVPGQVKWIKYQAVSGEG